MESGQRLRALLGILAQDRSVRALVLDGETIALDAAGRPSQVMLQASSGHPALDEAAISAVRAAQFRPYSDGGAPQPVWVLVPINFVLR